MAIPTDRPSIGNLTVGPNLNDNSQFENDSYVLYPNNSAIPGVDYQAPPGTGDDVGGDADDGIPGSTNPDTTGTGAGAGQFINAGPLTPPPFQSDVPVPEGAKENFEYWSVAELMSFQLEAALGARWQSLGMRAIMDGISLIKSLGNAVKLLGEVFSAAQNPNAGAQGGDYYYTQLPAGSVAVPVAGYKKSTLLKINVYCPWDPARGGYYERIPYKCAFNPQGGLMASRGGGSRYHEGIDIMMPHGSPVVAPMDGTITKVSLTDSGTAGLSYTMVSDLGPYCFFGCHIQPGSIVVQAGQKVKAGQLIGKCGSTGNASAGSPHLHWEVYRATTRDDARIHDPAQFLRQPGILDSITTQEWV